MGQENENDENQNRHYKHWDNRIKDTYTKDSQATLRNKLSDPYVKAFRWASDRIRTGGVIAFVTNNSFLDNLAFDGMRKHLAKDFNLVLHLDLKGNARTSGERRRREAGNIFEDQIRVGVGITLLVKNPGSSKREIRIYQVDDYLKSKAKTALISAFGSFSGTPTKAITPDEKHTWLNEQHHDDFATMMPLGSKTDKGETDVEALFRLFSLGVASNRDAWVYNSSSTEVKRSIDLTLETFYQEQARFQSAEKSKFAPTADGHRIKWTDRLREALEDNKHPKFHKEQLRRALYRPFDRRWMYFDHLLNQRRYQQHVMLPTADSELENSLIAWNTSPTSGMAVLATKVIPDLHFVGDSQCFSFYTYDEDGTNRRENITDWALAEFRAHYGDKKITKWDIFHAPYAVLHHPEYRTRYAANLKRELPRIPFAPDFHAFSAAGKRLMALHIDYEKQPQYPLEQIEDPKAEVSFRVDRMKLSKDKSELRYNDFLLLRGIPAAASDYRLGNRSALEWVIDQYRVSTDPRSGIVNDPNRPDDPKYILRLIGQVITVSLETQRTIATLPSLDLPR
jgi:predicted helicase